MSSANYFIEVLEKTSDSVTLSLALSHSGVIDIGSDRVFAWRLLQELRGEDAYRDDARSCAARQVARIGVSQVRNARETHRDARAVFVDPDSWVNEDTLPTFEITVEVTDPALLAGLDVGASADSYSYPDDGPPLLEGEQA